MDALELLKQDHKTVKELLRTAKETEDSKKQRQPFGKSGPSWKPMRRRSTRSLKDGRSVNVSALALIIRLPILGVCGPMRNQPPMHKPPLVNALLTDNHGNVGRSFRGDVKARRVAR